MNQAILLELPPSSGEQGAFLVTPDGEGLGFEQYIADQVSIGAVVLWRGLKCDAHQITFWRPQ